MTENRVKKEEICKKDFELEKRRKLNRNTVNRRQRGKEENEWRQKEMKKKMVMTVRCMKEMTEGKKERKLYKRLGRGRKVSEA